LWSRATFVPILLHSASRRLAPRNDDLQKYGPDLGPINEISAGRCFAEHVHVVYAFKSAKTPPFRFARFTSTRGNNRHTRAIWNCSTLILLISILSSRHYRRRPTQAPGAVVHNLMRQDIAIDAEMPLTHRARISRTLTRPSRRRLFRLPPTQMPMLCPCSILSSHHRRGSIRD